MQFCKDKKTIRGLINFGNEANTINLAYIAKLGFKVCPPNIGTQKIDGLLLKIFEKIIAGFQVIVKLNREHIFCKKHSYQPTLV